MKFRKILLMGAIAIGMIACKNDDIVVDKPSDNSGDTYVAFSIAMPNRSTRAAGVGDKNHKDTYEGTADEQAVKSVRVVLYDENNHAAYSFDFTPAAAHGTGDNAKKETDALYITDAKKVVKKGYKALVLLNPTVKVTKVTNPSQNLSEFELAATEDLATLTSKEKGFFMSNAQGLADVPTSVMKPTAGEAQNAPFKDGGNGIKVDRAVSKVFVGGTPKVVPPSNGATVNILGWKLDVTNKKLFWMRKFGKVVQSKNVFADEAIKDGSDRYNRYAMDPNFDSRDIDPNEYNYLQTNAQEIDNADLTKQSFVASVTNWNIANYEDQNGEYTMENTMQPWFQYESVTTRAIIKARFTPEGFTEAESWYSFDNVKMNKATFADYVAKVKAGTELPVEAPTGLKEAIETATNDLTSHNFDNDESGESYVMTFKTLGDKKLKFYKDGECYYVVKIRHFDDSQSSKTDYSYTKPNEDNGYGRYGVVRNNIYKLNLATISQPGDPVPENPDPETPDDKDELWLSVKTEILPWFVRVQDIDL